MGLIAALSRAAVRRPHVLLVEAPGQWLLRARTECELAGRGWRVADSPADADVLALCGPAGPQLRESVDAVWDQLPGPRARVQIEGPDTIGAELDEAVARLVDVAGQGADARSRRQSPDTGDDDMDHGEMDHGDMDHGDMDHGDMDHGDMEMAPAGIALAQGDEDRDGLEMDVLNVRLGPVLPCWPAGLVLRCTLHGDVIADAEASILDGGALVDPDEARAAARRCDHLTSLLRLAGSPRAARRARAARDALLLSAPDRTDDDWVQRLQRSLRRSPLLRWSLRDLPGAGDGDARIRSLDELPALVNGLDLAGARVVIAGLSLETAGPGGR